MKKNIITILVTTLLVTASCTNMEEELYDKVQDDDFGTTPKEVEALVGGAYSSLRGFSDEISNSFPTCEYVFFLNEVASDEATIPTRGQDWYDGGRYQQTQRHTWDAENGMILSAWRYCYTGISKVNSIIYQIDQSGLSEDDKKPIYAELKAIRAYYYYRLLDMFGNVPIITDFKNQELPANSTRKEVYDFVESELLNALPYLRSEIVYSKFTKNVAYTLLARLYLNSEAFVGIARWQDCIAMCQQVSGYSINPDFFANFATENQGSNELIFAIPYDSDAGTVGNYLSSMTYHYLHQFTVSVTGDYPWCGNGICAQPGAYSKFLDTDKRKASMLEGEQINLATGSVLIMDSGEPLIYTEAIEDFTNAKQNEGVRLSKYEVKEGEKWERDHDWVVMRYAEVLMMQAECYVRMGSPELARPFLDQIAQRAGTETPDVIDLDYINDELLREFAFEGRRRTDNIRFGTFFEPWWEKESTPKYRGIFPIPQSELDKNKNLKQNPEY
ncbi:RagB/SusD family nutrient uptake outer membrane protein [Galbibacter pacificus]|uniref:RagB/SusD family nutrient uptake outer membrane protein n=1 Tax=Galbibacter pacificus TaxID=2996052 RepID=A0ABT6FMX2_9FLAO|nr:RagB/SusD family nutrient uptake outer membrane protein [Galbibacter pacificus]MDG3581134.1 RagB/SusD family nutrient uptake outer membrane protein [Galbibacter pacificus]MDG3584612.1 RagB/SusD family nutrient uptake outer membrane protein [Galbibacter pacificus]